MRRDPKIPVGDALALTRALIAIDSRNPSLVPGAPGEGPVAEFLAAVLRDWGFQVDLLEALPGRPNVIAVRALLGASRALKRGAPSIRSNATSTPAVSTTATVTPRPSVRAAAVTWSTIRRAPEWVMSGRSSTDGASPAFGWLTPPT